MEWIPCAPDGGLTILTLLALHGSSRDETDLAEYSVRIAPQARVIAPRGTFQEGGVIHSSRRRVTAPLQPPRCAWRAVGVNNYFLPHATEKLSSWIFRGAVFAEACVNYA